jgi:hypothetical protein
MWRGLDNLNRAPIGAFGRSLTYGRIRNCTAYIPTLMKKDVNFAGMDTRYAQLFSDFTANAILNLLYDEIYFERNGSETVPLQSVYTASGVTSQGATVFGKKWPYVLYQLKCCAERCISKPGLNVCFDIANVAYFNNGGEYTVIKADWCTKKPVVCFYFGESRFVTFRPVSGKGAILDQLLDNGGLLVMHQPTATYWKYGLTEDKVCKAPGYFITFRTVI